MRHGEWDWLVFTSANGVHALLRRLDAIGRDLRDLGAVKLAAIGPKTADALREYRLRADVVPEAEFSSEGLAAALAPLVAGQRVLLARANRGRELLRDELAKIAARVEQVAVYDQVDAVEPDPAVLDAPAPRRDPLRHAAELEHRPRQCWVRSTRRSAAGSSAARSSWWRSARRRARRSGSCGYPVAAEAKVFTEDGLIDAVVELAARGTRTAGYLRSFLALKAR